MILSFIFWNIGAFVLNVNDRINKNFFFLADNSLHDHVGHSWTLFKHTWFELQKDGLLPDQVLEDIFYILLWTRLLAFPHLFICLTIYAWLTKSQDIRDLLRNTEKGTYMVKQIYTVTITNTGTVTCYQCWGQGMLHGFRRESNKLRHHWCWFNTFFQQVYVIYLGVSTLTLLCQAVVHGAKYSPGLFIVPTSGPALDHLAGVPLAGLNGCRPSAASICFWTIAATWSICSCIPYTYMMKGQIGEVYFS